MKSIDSSQRLGLALSGGGFRASFYHIGVLAKMAELGMLKHVEAVSTVSGGSIVGAAYYLLLKQLLEGKTDDELSDQDYIELVKKLEVHFLGAVQKNLRMRTFANPFKNMRMARANYSRSDMLGELYEEFIYRPLIDVGDGQVQMTDLLIEPKGAAGGFHPWDEAVGNPARTHKVPVLILNATSLNSGHNWIFTATSMGEVPPRNLNFRDIDKKDRYRRVRYEEITTRDKDFLLGKAVAASAGVPGLFPPMAVSNLYLDRRVQLVDGGVYDNQGIAGLLDPDCCCTDFVVSDASGQSDAADNPDTAPFPVLLKVSGIMGGRVREEMVNCLELVHPDRIAYFHLTRGLFAKDIEVNKGGVSAQPGIKMRDGIIAAETEFDITETAQKMLAHIRTDLDSFTDVEAGCLAADAYQMSEPRLLKMIKFLSPEKTTAQYRFGRYLPALKSGDERVVLHLDLGRFQFFKPYLYVFNGACSIANALKLLLVSLPLLLTLAVIVGVTDWALSTYLRIDVWKILTNKLRFQAFMFDIAPALYVLGISFLLSKVADILISGSGRIAGWIQKIMKGPMSLISNFMIRVILPFIIAVPIIVYLHTIERFFIRVMGKAE